MSTEENADKSVDRLQLAEELFAFYRQDQAAGILDARMRWAEIDPDLLSIAADWADSAAAELSAPDPVSLFGTTGYDWAFFVEAQNTIGFYHVLKTVAEHEGDPPASELLKRYSLDILRGRVHLTGAIRLVSTDTALLAALPNLYQTFLPGMDPEKYPILSQAVRVAAAAALPRSELYRLRGLTEETPGEAAMALDQRRLDEIREEFRRVMEQAILPDSSDDPSLQEQLLVRALELAGQSPEPDDDIEALEQLLQLAERFRVSTDSVRRCASTVQALVAQGHCSKAVARCLAALVPSVVHHDLMQELGDVIVRDGSRLLESNLEDEEVQVALKSAVARAWLGLGRRDRARALLDELERQRLSSVDRLKLAAMEVDTLETRQDRARAVDLLLQALEEAQEAGPEVRIPALQKLMELWPETRDTEGLLPYIDELLTTAKSLREPRRTLCLVGSAIRLWSAGRRVQALRAWSTIDEERIRRETPPVLAEKVLAVVRKARKKLDTARAETVVT